jgi:microcystin-dependent protein
MEFPESSPSSTIDWKLVIPLFFILSIMGSSAITYWIFSASLSDMQQQHNQLKVQFEPVQVLLDALENETLTAQQVHQQLGRVQERLLAEIQISRVNDTLLTQQIENLNKLNDKLMADLRAVLAHNDAVTAQLNNTHGIINDLIKLVDNKTQLIATVAPPGTVTAYAGAVDVETRKLLVQSGWLVCDGTNYRIQDYQALYHAIGTVYGGNSKKGEFKVPDFRGVFLRGLDAGRQMDVKRQLGQYQGDMNRGHSHTANMDLAGEHTHQARTDVAGEHRHRLQAQGYWYTMKDKLERRSMTSDVNDFQEYWTNDAGAHSHKVIIDMAEQHRHPIRIGDSGGEESRPKNYPVTYLIRF